MMNTKINKKQKKKTINKYHKFLYNNSVFSEIKKKPKNRKFIIIYFIEIFKIRKIKNNCLNV